MFHGLFSCPESTGLDPLFYVGNQVWQIPLSDVLADESRYSHPRIHPYDHVSE